jgi:FkbM family methyltransferase
MTAVTAAPFVSYAQNGEDVVLHRALGDVESGRYVDVGANSPEADSVTKAFYDRGWTGLDVEPVHTFAEQLRAARSRSVVVEAAVTAEDGGEVVLHEVVDTGLSTTRAEYVGDTVDRGHEVREVRVPSRTLRSLVSEHLGDGPVHFCKVDVEGAEGDVLRGADLASWRPWVLVVEATRPNSTEPTHEAWEATVLAAGYRFCLFDGLSRWYVAEEHAERLAPRLAYPACPLDDWVPATQRRLEHQLHEIGTAHRELSEQLADCERRAAEADGLRAELLRWRGIALERWSAGTGAARPADDGSAQAELDALKQTLSWRVTAPLRAVRSRQLGAQRPGAGA